MTEFKGKWWIEFPKEIEYQEKLGVYLTNPIFPIKEKIDKVKKRYEKIPNIYVNLKTKNMTDIGGKILEININSTCLNQNLDEGLLYKIAGETGIKFPSRTIEEGGYKEERCYKCLNEIIKNTTKYQR